MSVTTHEVPPEHEDKPKEPVVEPKRTPRTIPAWLSHPLLLLLVGAFVTNIIIPRVTSAWQRNQTAQDMKTQVITDVTDAVTAAMTQLDITQSPVFASNNPQAAPSSITGTYATFMQQDAKVASELHAYFPENKIPIHWDNLAGLVKSFYLFTYAHDATIRQQNLASIRHYFTVHHAGGGIDWNTLLNGDRASSAYRAQWVSLEKLIVGVRDKLTASIMDAPAPSF